MKDNAAETLIGALVLAVAAGFLFFMTQSTGFASDGGSYELKARFQSAEGITVGSDVRLAGVKIGSVVAMNLDPTTYLAETTLSLKDTIDLT